MAQPDDIDSTSAGTARSTRSCTSSMSLRRVATHQRKSIWRERYQRTRASEKRADVTSDNSPTSSFGTCGTTPSGTPRPQPSITWQPLDKIHLTRELRVDLRHCPAPHEDH